MSSSSSVGIAMPLLKIDRCAKHKEITEIQGFHPVLFLLEIIEQSASFFFYTEFVQVNSFLE